VTPNLETLIEGKQDNVLLNYQLTLFEIRHIIVILIVSIITR